MASAKAVTCSLAQPKGSTLLESCVLPRETEKECDKVRVSSSLRSGATVIPSHCPKQITWPHQTSKQGPGRDSNWSTVSRLASWAHSSLIHHQLSRGRKLQDTYTHTLQDLPPLWEENPNLAGGTRSPAACLHPALALAPHRDLHSCSLGGMLTPRLPGLSAPSVSSEWHRPADLLGAPSSLLTSECTGRSAALAGP